MATSRPWYAANSNPGGSKVGRPPSILKSPLGVQKSDPSKGNLVVPFGDSLVPVLRPANKPARPQARKKKKKKV